MVSVRTSVVGYDPLVELTLCVKLNDTYPTSEVVTLGNGQLPYLSLPYEYAAFVEESFSGFEFHLWSGNDLDYVG